MDEAQLGKFILITGGARSGKSRLAEKIALQAKGPVAYIATAAVLDEEMAHRVAQHRASRPQDWVTIEETLDLVKAIEQVPPQTEIVLVDCLTVWLTNCLLERYEEDFTAEEASQVEAQIQDKLARFCQVVKNKPFRTIVVTNEVGSGVVPDTPLGRIFRDIAGRANQQVAQAADSVWLAVAGYPLCVKEYGKAGL
ncbi:MAG: bifunctional adenosylcobinamide kinase/adenosylcobinamide-phosphate guanylyltransferase [Firmicutes bacterium]|nr:bifunctional adenosylcobinamide kinase/adenosylcobinamide-phosphate guanylyltransferase [Bacillota bacterium]